MTAITRRAALTGLAVGLALPLAGCARGASAEPLAMACGERGGSYLAFGELLGAALRQTGAAALRPLVTYGSAENIALLDTGVADLAIALADTAEGRSSDLLTIGRVYQNYLQCVARADAGMAQLADLAGATISIGAPGSGSSATTRRLLGAAGLGTGAAAPSVRELPLEGALAALASGEISAFFWSGGIPTPKITELDARLPLTLLDLSAALPKLAAAYPEQYLSTRVPPGVYSARRATPTVGIPNYLLVRRDFPDDAAAALVEVLVEHAAELIPEGTVGVQFLTPANLIDTGALPLHPGAADAYRVRYG